MRNAILRNNVAQRPFHLVRRYHDVTIDARTNVQIDGIIHDMIRDAAATQDDHIIETTVTIAIDANFVVKKKKRILISFVGTIGRACIVICRAALACFAFFVGLKVCIS